NLQTTIDSLSVDISDALVNPTLSDYHSEKWLVGASATYRAQDVIVPDGWTLVKNELDEDPHPHTGDWESNYYPTGGYGGSPGFLFTGDIDSTSDPSDEIYHSQLVNAPYREIYSVEISFRYNVVNTGSTSSEMFLFLRFAGIEKTFYVFETGDTTGSWLQETVILTSEDLQLITLPDSLLLDIGMGTDYTGSVSALHFDAYIDDIDLTMNVRPFPEQIGLKVNGTSVIGATQGSIYPYVPDDSNRDAEDHFTNGIDLNGYDNAGNLFISGWGTDYLNIETYDAGMQFPLSIPQGAVITSAYLEVEPTYEDGLVSVRVYAAGENSAGLPIENFITGLPHLEDQFNWVDTSIDWTVSSWTDAVRIRQRSPDIAPLIQSIVSDANWQDTNYVSLMLKYMWGSDSTSEFAIKGSSNYAQDEISRLFVEYMIPLPEDIVYFQQFEKDITISSSMTAATLTDFPVMIDITDADLSADAQADGDDIIFKLGNEALDFEIEYFDKGTGRLIAWVKVPTLPATQNTIITMAYGNPNAGSSSSARVWDDFETVHHLADDPSGTVYDSTANNHDGTSYGGLTSGNLVTGIGGNGINFDGINDVISIGQIDTDEWSDFTMSVWFYHDISGDERVFSKSSTTSPQDHIITLRLDGGDIVNTRMKTDGTGGIGADAKSTLTAGTGAWHYVSWSWSASRHSIIAYLDGTPAIDYTLYGTSVFDENSVFVIGNNDLTNAKFWDGLIDEARLTTSIRSEAWVDTEYNNQNNPSAYLSVGTKRTLQSTWSDAESTAVRFSTTSITPVDIFPIVTMDISAGGQTLDENMQEGTSYYVANDTVVEWTANVLVSPPA
ncbi:MAG: DUF2341 domain-containing protein, partial [Candidatus Thorarchaeota archaeon]|nr:DUF2341 domain-containing protein [Candidatus Thorarchaeota archaeon]